MRDYNPDRPRVNMANVYHIRPMLVRKYRRTTAHGEAALAMAAMDMAVVENKQYGVYVLLATTEEGNAFFHDMDYADKSRLHDSPAGVVETVAKYWKGIPAVDKVKILSGLWYPPAD